MDELRLILLGLGALVVAGVYVYSRFFSKPGRGGDTGAPAEGERSTQKIARGSGRREPGLSGAAHDEDEDLPSVTVDGGEAPAVSGPAGAQREAGNDEQSAQHADRKSGKAAGKRQDKEKLIVLNILPVEAEGRFRGNDLLEVFDRAGLEYGRFDVFHRMADTSEGIASVFSVASATEPGSFEISEMADESFKGLTMFMLLPGPQRGVDAFADMLATARRMAQQLNADVTDRNRSTMTRQTAHHIREEIIAFEHQFRRDTGRAD